MRLVNLFCDLLTASNMRMASEFVAAEELRKCERSEGVDEEEDDGLVSENNGRAASLNREEAIGFLSLCVCAEEEEEVEEGVLDRGREDRSADGGLSRVDFVSVSNAECSRCRCRSDCIDASSLSVNADVDIVFFFNKFTIACIGVLDCLLRSCNET